MEKRNVWSIWHYIEDVSTEVFLLDENTLESFLKGYSYIERSSSISGVRLTISLITKAEADEKTKFSHVTDLRES